MKTITVPKVEGLTVYAALMTAFDLKHQKEVSQPSALFNTYTVKGVDYDVFLRKDHWLIVEAY